MARFIGENSGDSVKLPCTGPSTNDVFRIDPSVSGTAVWGKLQDGNVDPTRSLVTSSVVDASKNIDLAAASGWINKNLDSVADGPTYKRITGVNASNLITSSSIASAAVTTAAIAAAAVTDSTIAQKTVSGQRMAAGAFTNYIFAGYSAVQTTTAQVNTATTTSPAYNAGTSMMSMTATDKNNGLSSDWLMVAQACAAITTGPIQMYMGVSCDTHGSLISAGTLRPAQANETTTFVVLGVHQNMTGNINYAARLATDTSGSGTLTFNGQSSSAIWTSASTQKSFLFALQIQKAT